MRFGIGTGPQNVDWDELRRVWREADGLGYDSAWVFDHLLPLSPNPDDPILEAWTTLAALAVETTNVRIGTLVSANTFRHPSLLAKMAATVDVISGGRLICGLGSGYLDSEHLAFGIPLPSVRDRGAMLAEACQVLKGLWAEGRFTFEGEHYTVRDAPCEPLPVQRPGPPLMIGGGGERVTLRTTALYADQWNMPPGNTGISPEDFARKHAVLKEHCEAVGRDPAEIETNVGLVVMIDERADVALERRRKLAEAFGLDDETAEKQVVAGDPELVVQRLREFEAVGVDHFVVALINGVNYGDVRLFGEAVVQSWSGS